ncbi:MAG: MMPL family transporter [Myxococcales bacterium]
MGRALARPALTLSVAAALFAASLPFAVELYANLRAQLEELLPQSAPSVVAIKTMHERLGESIGQTVLVTGATPEERHRFLDRLAQESHGLPVPPRLVDYRSDQLTGFFEPRKALFVDLADLRRIEQAVEDRIAAGESRANPLFDLGLEEPEDEAQATARLDSLLEKYRGGVETLRSYPTGYYDSPDGTASVILFYPGAGATSYEDAQAFHAEIDKLARRVAAAMGLSLEFEYTGDVQQVIQEQSSLMADLLFSSIVVAVLELLLVLLFYRWWPAMVVLGAPLALGTVMTFALGWFFIGSLNASSAFLGAIVVGNGINSGVMLLSRFLEERRRDVPVREAVDAALRGTLLATVVASLASAVAYAALMATNFRGYNHFGFMGGVGMVLCWVANMLLVPVLALHFERRFPYGARGEARKVDRAFGWVGRLGTRRAGPSLVVCALVTAASLVAILHLAAGDPIEEDTKKLRSRWASEPGGYIAVGLKVDAILKRVTTPVVVLVERMEEVREVGQRYREREAQAGPDQLLGQVLTVYDLVPDDQAEKLEVLGRIRDLLTPTRLAHLDVKTRGLAQDWLPPPGLTPFGIPDLPEGIRRQFRERDGSEGKVVLLFPKYGTDTTNGRILRRFAAEVRSVPLPPGAVVAGSYLIFADMISSLQASAPVATTIAFVGVVLLSLFLAGSARGGLFVTLSLLVGVAWTLGAGAVAGMRLNFLNFIALPITFGIGVDYAANVYGRYRLGAQTRQGMSAAIEHSGAAVAMASATTIIGYSALLFSRNGAIYSFGSLAVLGEIACLASALIVLPAMVALRLPRDAVAPPPDRPRGTRGPMPPPAQRPGASAGSDASVTSGR